MTKYEQYSTIDVVNIPPSELDIIVRTFVKQAEVDMGSEFDEVAFPRVIEFISKEFKHLPLYAIGSAFKKGALGHFGPGRLVPRTIYGWLSETSQAHLQQSKNLAENIDDKKKWDGIHQYPVGKAIIKKIEWYEAGLLDMKYWDDVPLKRLAEMIANKEHFTLETFGITPLKPKPTWY